MPDPAPAEVARLLRLRAELSAAPLPLKLRAAEKLLDAYHAILVDVLGRLLMLERAIAGVRVRE